MNDRERYKLATWYRAALVSPSNNAVIHEGSSPEIGLLVIKWVNEGIVSYFGFNSRKNTVTITFNQDKVPDEVKDMVSDLYDLSSVIEDNFDA